ncbi:UNVERIFIED_CONTAM: hypothetical protein Cloal_2539 [Acetivibrio alkalicellulosi]
MDEHKVNLEELYNSSLRMKNIIHQIDDIVQSIYKDIDGFKGQWISCNSDKFGDIARDELKGFKDINDEMLEYAKFLCRIAETYKEKDKKYAEKFKK